MSGLGRICDMLGTPRGVRTMRYALTTRELQIIQPTLPRRSRGVPRVDDRRILNGSSIKLFEYLA
jgi:hypothetical protein